MSNHQNVGGTTGSSLNLTSNLDSSSIRNNESSSITAFMGHLQLTVLQGRSLKKSELGVGGVNLVSTSSPYCVLSLDDQKFKTKTETSSDPHWNQTFNFNVSNPFSGLQIEVLNERTKVTKDEHIGSIYIPLTDLVYQQSNRKSWKIRGKYVPTTTNSPSDPHERELGEIELVVNYKFKEAWNDLYRPWICLKNRDFQGSIRFASDGLVMKPTNMDLFAVRIDAFLGIGNFDEALKDIRQMIELAPNSPKGFFKLGQLYLRIQQLDEARETFEEGLRNDGNYYPLLNAYEELQVQLKSQKLQVLISRGKKAFEEDQLLLAIDYFNDGLKQHPENWYLYALRGTAYAASNEINQATEDALKVAQLSPTWPRTNAIYQAFVSKQGKINTMMKKRWLVLKGYFIYYYKSNTDLKPQGVIILSKNFEVQKRKELFFRVVTPNRIFEMKAENVNERNKWIEILEKIMNQTQYKLPVDENTISQTPYYSSLSEKLIPLKGLLESIYLRRGKTSPIRFVNISKQGFLNKCGRINVQWKRRYFILQEDILYYFSSQPELLNNEATPDGSIFLKHSKIVKAQEKTMKEFSFEIATPDRSYYLHADTIQEYIEWLEKLCAAAGVPLDSTEAIPPTKTEYQTIPENLLKPGNRKSLPPADNMISLQDPASQSSEFTGQRKVMEVNKESYSDHQDISKTIGDSQSRYFKKFGLTPPTYVESNVEVDDIPPEATLLNEKRVKLRSQEEEKCCASCTLI